jgi:hypothetical protein
MSESKANEEPGGIKRTRLTRDSLDATAQCWNCHIVISTVASYLANTSISYGSHSHDLFPRSLLRRSNMAQTEEENRAELGERFGAAVTDHPDVMAEC